MMFKNSLRLLFSNFVMVWKILLYKLTVALIIFGLASAVAMPIINTLSVNGFFVLAKDQLQNLSLNLNVSYIMSSFGTVASEFVSIIGANYTAIMPSLVATILIVVFLGTFISSLSRLGVAESLHGYMSSYANYSFSSSFVRKLKKSIKMSLAQVLIHLPINAFILFLMYLMVPMLNSPSDIIMVFAPFIIIVLGTVIIALNLTVFSGVVPAMVVHDCSVIRAYRLGFAAVGRRFYKTLSTSVMIVLSLLTFNLFLFMLMGVAGLLITLPTSIFLLAIFGMVMYYGSMGMKYYVDPETILAPKKLEEQDKINKTKYII